MPPFAAFVSMLAEIDDPRRAEGKVYRPPHVMLFAILAIVSGAGSTEPSTVSSMLTSRVCVRHST